MIAHITGCECDEQRGHAKAGEMVVMTCALLDGALRDG